MKIDASIPVIQTPTTDLDRLREMPGKTLEQEKNRLKKATREFESFFLYQMLKTMRKTVPGQEQNKNALLSGGMGKDVYTDLFDMEISRKVVEGGQRSLSQMLYDSLEKLIEARFADTEKPTEFIPVDNGIKDPLELEKHYLPMPTDTPETLPLDKPVSLMPISAVKPAIKEDTIMSRYGEEILDAARETNLDSTLIASVIKAESGGDPDAVSGAGAKGLMQLMDSTAQDLGVKDVFDPAQNIRAGSRFLKKLLDRFGGDLELALAAYNAGPARVEQHGGVPPFKETRDYVTRIVKMIDQNGR